MHRYTNDEVWKVGYRRHEERQKQAEEILGRGVKRGYDATSDNQGYGSIQEDVEDSHQGRTVVGGVVQCCLT